MTTLFYGKGPSFSEELRKALFNPIMVYIKCIFIRIS